MVSTSHTYHDSLEHLALSQVSGLHGDGLGGTGALGLLGLLSLSGSGGRLGNLSAHNHSGAANGRHPASWFR